MSHRFDMIDVMKWCCWKLRIMQLEACLAWRALKFGIGGSVSHLHKNVCGTFSLLVKLSSFHLLRRLGWVASVAASQCPTFHRPTAGIHEYKPVGGAHWSMVLILLSLTRMDGLERLRSAAWTVRTLRRPSLVVVCA
jgi:hypothetical protein